MLEPRSHSNGRGTKKHSYTLAEKQAYVKLYHNAIANSPGTRGVASKVAKDQRLDRRLLSRWIKSVPIDPVPIKLRDKRKLKSKKKPDKFEEYAVDLAMSRKERGLPVNAKLVAVGLKRKFAEEFDSKSIDSIA